MSAGAHVPSEVRDAFGIDPASIGGSLAGGHINRSFAARIDGVRVVVQSLSAHVFPDPLQVVTNARHVARHLLLRAPGFVPAHMLARDGQALCHDAQGRAWRVLRFLPGHTRIELHSPAARVAAGWAFGRLQALLADCTDPFPPTIAGFTDPYARSEDLLRAVAQVGADTADAALVAQCHELQTRVLDAFDGLDRGPIHADTKPANLRLAGYSGNETVFSGLAPDAIGRLLVRGVIDLDTVHIGPRLFDLADLVRAAAVVGAEDDERADVDAERIVDLARGFVAGARGLVRVDALADLPRCCACVAWMLGSRFLADHLRADVYFAVRHRGHNRQRARAQLQLAARLLARRQELTDRLCALSR